MYIYTYIHYTYIYIYVYIYTESRTHMNVCMGSNDTQGIDAGFVSTHSHEFMTFPVHSFIRVRDPPYIYIR